MALSATYMSDLSRVRVAFSGLSTDADYAVVERSVDGITWATVRGGDKVSVSAGAGKLDDFEFTAGVSNSYRVTAVDSASVGPNGFGAYTTGNNTTLAPPLPGAVVAGSMMVLFATHRNTGATVSTPAGWTLVSGGASNFAVFYRVYQPGDTAPSVAFTGGSAGDSCSAQIRAWTNAQAPAHIVTQSNVSAQNVDFPGATINADGLVWILHEWKQSTGTGASLPSSFGDPQGGFNTAGANAESQITWRTESTVNVRQVLPATSAWTGGTAAVSKARLLVLVRRANVGVQTTSVVPALDSAWLKNPSRPSLNTAVTVAGIGDITRKARSGTFDVIGRTMPVVVSDLMSSRGLSLTLMVPSLAAAAELDGRLAAGDPIFIQAPTANAAVPTLYASVTGYTIRRSSQRGVRRFFDLDLVEVAAPASTVYGGTITYNDLPGLYASYDSLAASVASYFNLMDLVAPVDVIVP